MLVWDLSTGTPKTLYKGDHGLTSVDVSPDGKTIVTGEYGPEVKLWDVATATAIRKWDATDGNHVAFSPDGSMVVSASYRDGSIRVWKPGRDEPVHVLKDNPDGVEIAFRPGTTILASASTDGVRFWDVTAGHLIDKWEVEGADDIAFSRDGRMLAVSSTDKLTVWDADAPPSVDDLIAEPSMLAFGSCRWSKTTKRAKTMNSP